MTVRIRRRGHGEPSVRVRHLDAGVRVWSPALPGDIDGVRVLTNEAGQVLCRCGCEAFLDLDEWREHLELRRVVPVALDSGPTDA